METSRSREFGTQTEVSDLTTTDAETDREIGTHNKNSELSKRSRSISNLESKEEKPRWGSNPEKKVYIKQSEKDPNYQKILRRRQLMHGCSTSTRETESESIPFHRVQNRAAKTREKQDRLAKSKSPLKSMSSKNYLVHGHSQSLSQSHVSAHLKTDKELSSDSNSKLNGNHRVTKTKSRSPPKIGRNNTFDTKQVKLQHVMKPSATIIYFYKFLQPVCNYSARGLVHDFLVAILPTIMLPKSISGAFHPLVMV